MYLSTTLQYTYSASSYWVYLARVWPTTPALPWEDIQPGCIDPVSKDTVPTHADLHTNLNTHWGQILWGFFILDATFSLSPSRSSIASDCLKADSASSNFVPANRDCPWWNSSGKKFRLHPTTCSSNLPLSMVCLGDTCLKRVGDIDSCLTETSTDGTAFTSHYTTTYTVPFWVVNVQLQYGFFFFFANQTGSELYGLCKTLIPKDDIRPSNR